MKAYTRFIQWFDDKKAAAAAAALFIASMIPIWYLAGYARPSGDDYGYAILTRTAWVETHSLIEVLKAAAETVKQYYIGWSGDWFTTFVFSLMPEVFVDWSYWIVPLLMTAMLIFGTSVFLREVLVNILGLSNEKFIILDCILLIASYQYIPSTAIGMYWYVGSMHYIMPHTAALLTLSACLRFYITRKKRHLTAACFLALVVGGSSYFSSLLLFMVIAVFLVLNLWFHRDQKHVLWMILPFVICAFGFIIQCFSPGNSVRGTDAFGLYGNVAVYTIFESLLRSAAAILTWAREKTAIFILLFLFGLFSWDALLRSSQTWSFPYPAVFALFMYGCYSAMYAPEVYAEGFSTIGMSGGPATIQFLTFLLTAGLTIVYVEGWFMRRFAAGRLEYRPIDVGGVALRAMNLHSIHRRKSA